MPHPFLTRLDQTLGTLTEIDLGFGPPIALDQEIDYRFTQLWITVAPVSRDLIWLEQAVMAGAYLR